jgi:hypothetical protein
MTAHVMDADNARRILSSLQRAGVEATVGGGRAIDALLGDQTRLHSDLDLWVAAEDPGSLIKTFVGLVLDRLFPWGNDRPWNFVIHGRLRIARVGVAIPYRIPTTFRRPRGREASLREVPAAAPGYLPRETCVDAPWDGASRTPPHNCLIENGGGVAGWSVASRIA